MKLSPIKVYVGITALLAVGALVFLDWSALQTFATFDFGAGLSEYRFHPGVGLLALIFLGLSAETGTLTITVVKSAGSTSSIIFLPLLVSIVLFGSEATVLFIAVTGITAEFFLRKKELIRAVFNSSQYILSTFVAGLAWERFNSGALGVPDGSGSLPQPDYLITTVAFVTFGFVFLILNHGAVSLAIALNERVRLRKVWLGLVGRTGTNLALDFLVSPIAIAVALLYLQLGVPGLFIIVLPLLFIRQAYLRILELERANRDLLTALVKAIETRDPYTSGHSLRVASLAVRIADAMGLSLKKQKDVERAAMLHDIGKIESTYTEILSKPSGLTPEEREVIQSHVLKGVEVLEQLSSFSPDVIAAVRGHHERVDGKGYPDKLRGDEIPLGARIIKVCDAIDAMLSDRSYRRALTLEQVREQLVIYSGSQFDLEVVKASITGDVLEAHQAEIFLQKAEAEDSEETAEMSVGTRPKASAR
ncbi:MAG: HD-GYP domain-containing protein [Gemmatimonadetes bacterium]|nr:HD-GYP domain-containing protein [Gemmatimonadota bacterium]